MAYDIGQLRRIAADNPAALNADQKNALLEAALTERGVDTSRARRVSPAPDLSDPEDQQRLEESAWARDDPDQHLGAYAGGSPYMRRLTSTAKKKDPPQHERDKMLKLAAWLWDRNPIAARVIRRAVNYVLGEGIEVVARHKDEKMRDDIQKIIDDFWFDHRNQMDERVLRWALAWRAYGELALRVAVNPLTGKVRVAYISPEMIVDVKPEQNDIEHIESLVLRKTKKGGQGATDVELPGKTVTLPIVRVYEGVPVQSEDPAEARVPGHMYGEALYFPANTLPDMVQGRSDLWAIADVIDAYDQFIWTRLERQAMLLAFVWSVQLQGATQDDIDKWIKKNSGTPKPGSVQVHNEKVTWNAVAPSMGSGEALAESDLLLNYISTSQGMPGMWFGREQDPNRANGENLTGPTLKDLTCLQREFRRLIDELIWFVLDSAKQSGRLPEDLDIRTAFQVQMPDLHEKDMSRTAQTLGTLAAALSAAREGELVDLATSQEVFLLALSPTGIEVDIAEVRKRIEEEKAEKEEKAAEEQEQWYQQQAAYTASAGNGKGSNGQMPEEEMSGSGVPPPGRNGSS